MTTTNEPTTKNPDTFRVQFEYTDTFSGEANYSWVRRIEREFPVGTSDRRLVIAAKNWAGLGGVRCTRADFGDLIDLRPVGSCTVLFIQTLY